MKIAMFQMKMRPDPSENLRNCLSALQAAAKNGADLILYPELTLLLFFPQYENQDVSGKSVTIDAAEIQTFQKACRKNQIYAVPNFYYEENARFYDASLLIAPDGSI